MHPWRDPLVCHQSQIILRSFSRLLGRPLLDVQGTALEQARALYEAPFVVAAHGTGHDPVLNYGNRLALALWELEWDEFIATPSSRTAEPGHRDTRQAILAQVAAQGYAEHYAGIRVSHSGRRFRIIDTTIWNLSDEDGQACGQAATFARWEYCQGDPGSATRNAGPVGSDRRGDFGVS